MLFFSFIFSLLLTGLILFSLTAENLVFISCILIRRNIGKKKICIRISTSLVWYDFIIFPIIYLAHIKQKKRLSSRRIATVWNCFTLTYISSLVLYWFPLQLMLLTSLKCLHASKILLNLNGIWKKREKDIFRLNGTQHKCWQCQLLLIITKPN